MQPPNEIYDARLSQLIDETASHDLTSDDFTTSAKNLMLFSQVRNLMPQPDPTPEVVVPTTPLEKAKAVVAGVWDNETTRVLIKAGGAFGGVALVVYSSIKRDTVLERQAMQQANQRSI